METQGWQIAMAIGLGMGGTIALLPNTATAQLVADPSLGTTVEPLTAQIDLIKNGARSANGANLFHSFQEFNIGQNRGAYFIVPDANVLNILARVTGTNPSQILGMLGTRQQLADGTFLNTNANLFLMNPNGIIFGQGARLDVGGSFVATTANAIQFGDRGFFSTDVATSPSPLLTINPSAFLFNRINPTARIESRGASGVDVLQVPNGRSLLLLGGDIAIDGSLVGALGGRIEIGGLAVPGAVALDMNGNTLQLQFPAGVARADVFLNNQAGLVVNGAGGGDIMIYARTVNLAGNSILSAGISPGQGNSTTQAGDISINATDAVTLNGNSLINDTLLNSATGKSGNVKITTPQLELNGVSSISTGVGFNAIGSGGNIELNVQALSVTSGSGLFSSTLGEGNAGNIQIHADTVRFDDGSADSFTIGAGKGGNIDIVAASLLVTNNALLNAPTAGSGNGGDINITAGSVLFSKGGSVNSSTFGAGNAGNIRIRADSIRFDGTTDTLLVLANGDARVSDSRASSSVGLGAKGHGGNIEITARSLSVTNGASLSANTLSSGNAGDIRIVAQDDVAFVGGRQNGVFLNGEFGTITSGANVSTGSDSGRGGNIDIITGSLFVRDGAKLSADSFGAGNTGSIRITARDTVQFDGSITSQFNGRPTSFQSGASIGVYGSGNGGNIEISTGSLSVTNGGELNAGAYGTGNAGNILIQARDTVRFDGTDRNLSSYIDGIFSFRTSQVTSMVGIGSPGNGGNLSITARSLSVTNGADLSTTTLGSGNAGNIRLVVQDDTTFAGERPNGQFGNGQSINLASGASTNVSLGATGNGGTLDITTGSLFLRDGAGLDATTLGRGDAGVIQITARDSISLSGQDGEGLSSAISSGIAPQATGNGKTITITTGNLFLADGAVISARSAGSGNAGNIVINVRDALRANNGSISTRSTQSAGGSIDLTAGTIVLQGDSDILSSVFSGASNGGNITVSAHSIIALNDSDILAFARDGQGGNITLNTRAFFGQNYRPAPPGTDPATLNGNDRVDINASGKISGIITLPDVSFLQNGLTAFPQTFTDTTQLLANSCIVRSSKQKGRFVITGSGGLPLRPGDAPLSSYPTEEVKGVRGEERGVRREEGREKREEGREESYVIQNPTSGTQNLPDRPWKLGDPIVEPQGIYKLANGDLVMSRECK